MLCLCRVARVIGPSFAFQAIDAVVQACGHGLGLWLRFDYLVQQLPREVCSVSPLRVSNFIFPGEGPASFDFEETFSCLIYSICLFSLAGLCSHLFLFSYVQDYADTLHACHCSQSSVDCGSRGMIFHVCV